VLPQEASFITSGCHVQQCIDGIDPRCLAADGQPGCCGVSSPRSPSYAGHRQSHTLLPVEVIGQVREVGYRRLQQDTEVRGLGQAGRHEHPRSRRQ